MKNFLGLIYGIVYGVAHVVPGLSGSTFLVIFGCYDTICEAFALNLNEIKRRRLFLFFFVTGAIGGLVGFAHVITALLDSFKIQTTLFFMGLILGGIPLIARIATEEEKFKPACILPFLLGIVLVVSLFGAEKLGVFGADAVQSVDFLFLLKTMLYSFLAAIAMVMPGISGAFVLVAFGVYDMFMEALKGLDLSVLIPALIGIAMGIIAGAKLILLLIKKFKLTVYSAILGMVIGSAAPLFPSDLGLNFVTLTGIACLILGGCAAILLGKR